MDVEVMDVIAHLKRGDIAGAAEMSFSCIQCGLCASRCMGELPQYHILQLARRIYGSLIAPRAKHLRESVKAIESGKYEECLRTLMKTPDAELRKIYTAREMEPEMTGEDWTPKDKKCL